MKVLTILLSLFITIILLINCEEEPGNVIGSRDHDIKTARSYDPEILADGISRTTIIATVFDKEGNIAPNMRVVFETTHGLIDKFDISNALGDAYATLISEASNVDLMATITATVVDTAFGSMNKTVDAPYVVSLNISGNEELPADSVRLTKTNLQASNSATIHVKLLGVTIKAEIETKNLPADGLSKSKVTIRLNETTSQKAITNAALKLGAKLGTIDGIASTDIYGTSNLFLTAGKIAGADTVYIDYGNKLSTFVTATYITPQFSLRSKSAQTPADGESTIELIASLLTWHNNPIIGAVVKFSASAGTIPEFATTNDNGQAIVELIASVAADSTVMVVADFLGLKDTVYVAFVSTLHNYPNSILLEANPNFIWVTKTGNLEQTSISATILGVTGKPVGNDFGVRFKILKGPDGGECLQPSEGNLKETKLIPTVNGVATAYLRSGTKSGAVQIMAEWAKGDTIVAQTTNIVIRSGPPYIWIDPTNVDSVISRATLLIESGKANVAFGNPVQDIKITAIFGDKYNNPIEEGTAVYYTTTGGIITTDAITNEKGQATAILQNCNPFPYLKTGDPNLLTPHTIRNPNDESRFLKIRIPDFEGNLITNSLGTTDENDGVTVVLAYTWGKDQNDKDKKVWTKNLIVFSREIRKDFFIDTFYAYEVNNKYFLKVGEFANIIIRLYDIKGNPVASGSRLTVSATKGEISEPNLIPSSEHYGYGTTVYFTQLINNLDPTEDEETDSIVSIELNSPNGLAKISLSFHLYNVK